MLVLFRFHFLQKILFSTDFKGMEYFFEHTCWLLIPASSYNTEGWLRYQGTTQTQPATDRDNPITECDKETVTVLRYQFMKKQRFICFYFICIQFDSNDVLKSLL